MHKPFRSHSRTISDFIIKKPTNPATHQPSLVTDSPTPYTALFKSKYQMPAKPPKRRRSYETKRKIRQQTRRDQNRQLRVGPKLPSTPIGIYNLAISAIDDFAALEKKLHRTKTLVYLADNAGEEIFDKLFIQTIKHYFPSLSIYYFVRGRPIINDLTCKDALASKMDDVATIVDSGVPTPGLAIEFMTPYAKSLFENAECIISKGMGNYECLGDIKGLPIFFLFKVKCFVVARDVGAHLGDIICKKGIM